MQAIVSVCPAKRTSIFLSRADDPDLLFLLAYKRFAVVLIKTYWILDWQESLFRGLKFSTNVDWYKMSHGTARRENSKRVDSFKDPTFALECVLQASSRRQYTTNNA